MTYLRFMREQSDRNEKLEGRERSRNTQAMLRWLAWYDQKKDTPALMRMNPGSLYGMFLADATRVEIEEAVHASMELEKARREDAPELLAARTSNWDRFYARACQLWGWSARRFPYVVPIRSQGVDLLVTGDPARQVVLDAMGGELLAWASAHMFDDGFATVDPDGVLLDLLKDGYSDQLRDAGKEPLEHEYVERHDIDPDTALAAFGETVAKGLLVVGLIGLFVGAEVLTAGQATWLLVGLAGYSGIASYAGRRAEIEKTGYNVPIPVTMVHAAGDVNGVSQLIEGITGERLGTNRRLGSIERSQDLGAGVGSVALMLAGSRAYKGGQTVGARASAPTW